ncbi:hypothetical protein LCGC14_1900220 [marine sediment metagenome]|uniref:Uncharacterized protein n=1 Tax=marine sediment metagenome TaxID=412755 RepID=A0A0F9IUX3_9ZZZZ
MKKVKHITDKYPLIYLEWCDAYSNSSWISIEAALNKADSEDWVTAECGFLLKETKEYLLFCNRLGDIVDLDDHLVAGTIKIPKTWIRKRISLSKYITQA